MKRSSAKAVLALAAAISLAQAALASDLPGARLAAAHCGSCHSFDKGGAPGQGPNLYGLLDREAGASPGFRYSPNFLKAMRGRTWDAGLLDKWLADTQSVAPGNAMLYFQDDEKKRRMLVSYLQSLSDGR